MKIFESHLISEKLIVVGNLGIQLEYEKQILQRYTGHIKEVAY